MRLDSPPVDCSFSGYGSEELVLDVDAYEDCIRAYSLLRVDQLRQYSELVTGAENTLSQLHELERRDPPRFNIFRALGREYREVGTHSAMLAFLLDPLADHAQRGWFLDRFLAMIGNVGRAQGLNLDLPRPNDNSLSEWSCRKELALPDGLGRADIVVRGRGVILVIENKIHFGLGEDQLGRYWKFCQAEISGTDSDQAYVIYLTPSGDAPGDQQSIPKERLIRLSYREDVSKFLEEAAQTLEAESVGVVVRQYASLVKDIS
jgi:hypothetical protein